MSEEKMMAVCVSRDTVNVGTFIVKRGNVRAIDKIEITGFFYTSADSNVERTVKSIGQFKENNKLCLVDCLGMGIAYFDEIHKQYPNLKLVKMNSICLRQFRSNMFNLFKSYIENSVVNIDNYFTKDKQQLFYNFYNDGIETIDRRRIESAFRSDVERYRDLVEMICNLDKSECNLIYQERKNKIENNLTEIIKIYVEELKEADIKDKAKIDTLVHLIDKANYMREQF